MKINRMQTQLRQKCLLLSGSASTLPDDADNLNPHLLAHLWSKITDIDDCKRFDKPTGELKLLVTFKFFFVKGALLPKYITGIINKHSTHNDSNEDTI